MKLWMMRGRAVLVTACCALQAFVAAGAARAQNVLTSPDFGGMHEPYSSNVIAHDAVRGWTYVAAGYDVTVSGQYFVNGVRGSPLMRVNGAGVPDLNWVADPYTTPFTGIVLDDGGLLVFVNEWKRLVREGDGVYRAHALPMPASDVLIAPQSATSARDAAGNIYLAYRRYVGAEISMELRRLSANGIVDQQWRVALDGVATTAVKYAVAPDGTVYYLAAAEPPPFGEPVRSASLVRVATDGARWTRTITGSVAALGADAQGRVYLLGDSLGLQGKTGNLLRVDAAGSVDTGWSPAIHAPSPSFSNLLCVADGAVIAATASSALTRVTLDNSAVVTTHAIVDAIQLMPSCSGGEFVARTPRSVAVVTARTGAFAERRVPAVSGNAPKIARIQRWNDHYFVGGRFDYWFEGVLYQKLMRLKPDLRPDPTWRPEVTGELRDFVVDAAGGVVIASVSASATAPPTTALRRFAPDGSRDARWDHTLLGEVTTIAAASNGELYAAGSFSAVDGVPRSALARFVADGRLDTGWAPVVPGFYVPGPGELPNFFSFKRLVLGDDDVLTSWGSYAGFSETSGTLRHARSGPGAERPMTASLQRVGFDSLVRDDVSGALFGLRVSTTDSAVIELVQIDASTLELSDASPPVRANAGAVAFDSERIYLRDGTRLLRGGAPDGRWAPSPGTYEGRVATLGAERALIWSAIGAPLAVRTPSIDVGARTVVEYFARDANRFFITSRPNEQLQLDAMPSAFVRTGMSFAAYDGEIVPTLPGIVEGNPPQVPSAKGSLPVCRYFTPRERGGSGTHFYGLRSDCQLLNTLPGFTNEGYDFALHAANGSICPAATPLPVYRLFNNRVAQNDGNHRYVVSTARRDEMLARGWLDEGVVFCVTSATDSRAFGSW